MKHRVRIAAGTALALLMATAHATASAQTQERAGSETGHLLQASAGKDAADARIGWLLAQAEEEVDEEELIRRRNTEAEEAPAPAEEAPAQAEEPTPAEPEAAPEPQAQEAPATEEAPASAEETAPAAPEAAPEPQAQEAPATEEAPAPAEETAPPAPEAAPEPQAQEAPATEEAPASAEEPAPAAPEAAPEPQAQEAPAAEEAPATDEAPADEQQSLPDDGPVPEQAPPPPADGVEPLPGDNAPTPEPAPPSQDGEALPEESAPAPEQQPETPMPSEDGEPASGETGDQREAPLLDSAKEDQGEAAPQQGAEEQQPAETEAPADTAPPPTSDREAQQLEEPVEIVPLAAERGQRVERGEWHRERREGADVLREIGDRMVIQLNNQVVVRSDDRDRIGHGAEEVYYDELPRGRLRETVVRPNGVQVVTVYDRYGDVVARSRIMPDGREHVLVYAQDRHRSERGGWRDPGADLPPLHLHIPRDQYVLDAARVQEPDTYYDFFRQPPVEPVRRLYSIDEVRYSARLRDSVRRVELDTLTFEFGSASISESEVSRLQAIAEAMQHLLDDNPGETFLIEGHTDAVGADAANLALSDRRAEAVAVALTDVFDIPPENLVTQGYGESYLKINTQEPERENRRVVLRRITPLVAPVASAQ